MSPTWRPSPVRQRFVPRLEGLEARSLPSTGATTLVPFGRDLVAIVNFSSGTETPLPATPAAPVAQVHAQTGIRGVALAGPIVPVERPGVSNTRPLVNALIEVRRASGGPIVAQVRTDTHGRFTIPLVAGQYVLVPLPPQPHAFLPRAQRQMVTVPSSGFTSVVVNFDTGIR
jgi:hypothetical protein